MNTDIDTAVEIPENVDSYHHPATTMGRSNRAKSRTLPSSPTHSSSSDEFQFPLSPHKSPSALRPADELFHNGRLLPLHRPPLRTLLRASSDTTASRSSCDSSSAAADEDPKPSGSVRPSKYFSLSKFTSAVLTEIRGAAASSAAAKDAVRNYLKKVKPICKKLAQKRPAAAAAPTPTPNRDREFMNYSNKNREFMNYSNKSNRKFSGNLRRPGRRRYVASCPSSPGNGETGFGSGFRNPDASSMEELQSAIEGAIAHCKNSMMKKSNSLSNLLEDKNVE